MSRREDLTGQQFNSWYVLEYVGNSYYLCRCNCGKEKNIRTNHLKSGESTQCKSCATRSIDRNREDLTGKQFGSWYILEYAGVRNGSYYYRCRCNCGEEKEVQARNLKSGNSTKCKSCANRNRDRVEN